MNIAITGASGFIGSRLLSAVRSCSEHRGFGFSSKDVGCPQINYRCKNDLQLLPIEKRTVESIDVLIHAGAYIPKRSADANDISACNSNIAFTEKLLKLPWRSLTQIVYLSSVDVYGNQSGPLTEASAEMPETLYGWSKLYCEKLMSAFSIESGVKSQVLRIGHVYGPGEEAYFKLIPNSIRRCISGLPIELWGSGSERRSFIYIDDVVIAVLRALHLEVAPGVLNVVGEESSSVRHVLELIGELCDAPGELQLRLGDAKPRDLFFDCKKFKEYIKIDQTSLRDGLSKEIAHMRSLADG